MNKLYELLLMRKKEFDYSLLFASIVILCISIMLRHKRAALIEGIVEIMSPVLLGCCILGLWAWCRTTRYAYYSKKIRKKYANTVHRYEYKLKRLTTQEVSILFSLLNQTPIRQIAVERKLPVAEICRCIDILVTKLDIQKNDSFSDIDWKNAVG